MKNLSLSTLLLCMLAPLVGQAREPLTDHVLIAPYEGSTIRRKQVKEFDEYQAFKGMDASGKQATGLQLEGKITKILYKIPPERSILEIYRNYEDAVNRAGAEILYSCDQKKQECAKRYAAPTLQKYSDIHSISNLAGRYLLARVEQDEHTAYIAIAVGQISTDIHVIEVKKKHWGKGFY